MTENGERIVMKITGVLVKLLVDLNPELYGPHVVTENGKNVLCVEALKALYGMLQAALQWYIEFRAELEKKDFEFNPHDPCVANRMIDGKQQTIRFHVDDVMSSHMDPTVNDHFLKWLNKKCGDYGEVKATRGKKHDYLGMVFDFSEPGKVKIDMSDYVHGMIDDFPVDLGNRMAPTPAANDLFEIDESEPVAKQEKETFHTHVAKALFACKRARPDMHTATAFLCTRAQKPNKKDWNKLIRLMEFLNGTKDDVLVLSADDLHVLKWHIDASFAMHPDFKSHTGGLFTYGTGAAITTSRKQKLNTRSSTEAELVATDDMVTMVLWTKLFLEAQGIEVKENVIYQDNKSTILLQQNGKKSSSKRTHALNIRCFF